jgi:BCD family chlorophyll transporter-like MFS transporter
MYVMLLAGTIVSAIIFGTLLADFSPGRLIQVIQGSAVATIVLNTIALWKQETRRPSRMRQPQAEASSFLDAWRALTVGTGARRRLAAIGLGTMAFTMQDVLLEPYGGQILDMTVGATTTLTASLALGGLAGFSLASIVLGRGADPFRMSVAGALLGIPAFAMVILSGSVGSVSLFVSGVALVGFGGGLFSHGTLTATMNSAPPEQTGLALGAWGAVQATAAGIAVALGGIINDGVGAMAVRGLLGPALSTRSTGYVVVYGLEIVLLAVTVFLMVALLRRAPPAVRKTGRAAEAPDRVSA